MQGFKRIDRVSEMISRELSYIIDREMRDERVKMATVTGVEVSPDLRSARVFVSVLDDEHADETVEVLNNAAMFIRSKLGERIVLKYLPKLLFILDTSATYGLKMDKLFESLHNENADNDE